MSSPTFDEESGLWIKWGRDAQPLFCSTKDGAYYTSVGMDKAMAADRVMFAAMYPGESSLEAEREFDPGASA